MALSLPRRHDFLHTVPPVSKGVAFLPTRRTPHYFLLREIGLLNDILLQPGHLFVETGLRQQLASAHAILCRDSPDFALSLTTPSAYHDAVPEVLSVALEKRFGCKTIQRMKIRTCLQEAIANALIHGNLALTGPRESQKDFESYYSAIHSLIGKDPYKNRRVCLAAWNYDTYLKLAVTDEGDGLLHRFLPEEIPCATRKSGRGLFIIRSLAERVWLGKDGRTLFMTLA